MTTLNFHDAPPLRTDADVLARVQALIGPAAVTRQLWIMFIDGDGRQTPVIMPVADVPREPEPGLLRGLGKVLGTVCSDLATDAGAGSVILTLDRRGCDALLPTDRAWADALRSTCAEADATLRGVYLSTDSTVRSVP